MNTITETEAMIHATITYKDSFYGVMSMGASYYSLANMVKSIELYIGAANLISIEITSNK